MKKIFFAIILLTSCFFSKESSAAVFESINKLIPADTAEAYPDGDIKVSNTGVGMSYSQESAVAYLDNGSYVVSWMEYYDLDPNGTLFFQIFNTAGVAQGSAVDSEILTDYGWKINSTAIDGGFVVSTNREYRLYNNDGSPASGVMTYTSPNTGSHWWFGMSRDADGGFLVSYNNPSDSNNPYLFKHKGIEEIGSGDRVSEILLYAGSSSAIPNVIGLSGGGYFTIFQNGARELIGQFVTFNNGTGNLELSGSPIRIDQNLVNPYISSDNAYAVSQNSEGNLLISWYDARIFQNGSGSNRIYGRILIPEGTFLTDEFIIADEIVETIMWEPTPKSGRYMNPWVPTATTSFGDNFLVGWLEKDGTDQTDPGLGNHLKGRVVNNDGTFATDIFKMESNENITAGGTGTISRTLYPMFASNGTDSVMMTWLDGRNSTDWDAGTEIRVNFWEVLFNEPINEGSLSEKFLEDITSGFITIQGEDPTQTQSITFTTDYTITDQTAEVLIPSGTIITKTGGGTIDLTSLDFEDIADSLQSQLTSTVAGAISIGIPSLNLSFSNPITISIPVDPSYNGQTLSVYFQRENESSWNGGLSCLVADSFCTFETDHATTYLAGEEPSEGEVIIEEKDPYISSYKAYLIQDKTNCPQKLKLSIKGKRFEDNMKVYIGDEKTSNVNVKTSKEATATFCLKDLPKSKAQTVKVKNENDKSDTAKKKIKIKYTSYKIDKNNLDQNTPEGLKNIQSLLIKLKYLTNKDLTKVLDQTTINAIKAFQRDNNLPQVGVVGPLTKGKMQSKIK